MNRVLFIKSAGVLLCVTALAKLATAFEGAKIVDLHDPVTGFRFRHEFLVVGIVEMLVACVCFFVRISGLQLGLIAWLGTIFAIYRIGLWSIGVPACPCLGNFPDAIHLSKTVANAITFGILVYLLLGSYGGLLSRWLRKLS
jgi:hypothetical protein